MISLMALHALTTFSVTKMLLQYTQPFFLLGIRMSIAGTILLGYYTFFARQKFQIQKKHIIYFVQIVLFALYIPYALRYYGLIYCPESRVFLLYNTGPLITYLCVLFFAVERFNLRKMVVLCISYAALFLISPNMLQQKPFLMASFGLPDCALLCSVISFSYGWFLIRKLITEFAYTPFMINGISMTCGGILALVTSLCVETSPYITQALPFILPLAVLILISNIVCHNWYTVLVKKYSQTFVVLGSMLCPFFNAFYTAFLYNEMLSWHYFCGFFVTLMCLFVYYCEERMLFSVEQNQNVIT